MNEYKHLRIKRIALENPRRTRDFNIQPIRRPDKKVHSQKLAESLNNAITVLNQNPTSEADKRILKVSYSGFVDLQKLVKHGLNFISQEDNTLCIIFTDQEGLETFSDNIQKLGNEDDSLTYKNILEAIESIDTWTNEDRKSWAIRNKGFPEGDRLTLDVELWPIESTDHPHRSRVCSNFENWMSLNSIRRIDKINLDSLLMYRLDLNSDLIDDLLNHSDIRMVDLLPESGISYNQLNISRENLPRNIPHPSEDAARICILDSGIATNHPLLAPAIAESQSFIRGGEDVFDHNGHGTSVASVALYGDLEACSVSNYWQPEILIFNGKVLDENAEYDTSCIEGSIIEAVEYFVQEHQCRIFNLSVGNQNSPYDGTHIRGLAYILDKLARDFDILFIVSAGNFTGSTNPDVPENSWRDEYPNYLLHETCTIIDPAPALNVLTVGSLARHNATMDQQRYPEITQLSPANENQPSPFTRRGPSVRGAIKPELVATGGNLASKMRFDNQFDITSRGLGVLTCNNQFIGGSLLSEVSGTSFAAPYITHLAGRLLNNYPEASSNLLRALLVNHANLLPEIESTFENELKKSYKADTKREVCRDIAGYGRINENELFRSTENVVVLLLEDTIENNNHHFIEIPLSPEFLRSKRASREIRVTLAYCPAVKTTRQDYIATKMSFCLIKDDSIESAQNHFDNETRRNFDTRNDDAKSNRDVSSDLRSKGTVQSSTWRMRQRNPNDKWFIVVTRQDKIWAELLSFEKENYALVITLTDRENENAQLYTQISQRIQQQNQQRVRI